MVLIGLWHGFSWLYLLWGVYHGIWLGLETIFQKSLVQRRKVSAAYFYFRCAVTQLIVLMAIVVYSGSSDTVLRIYKGLFGL